GATVISNLLIPSLGLADRPTSLGISRKPCAEFSPRNQRVSTKHTILRQSRAADSGAGDGIRHRHDPHYKVGPLKKVARDILSALSASQRGLYAAGDHRLEQRILSMKPEHEARRKSSANGCRFRRSNPSD